MPGIRRREFVTLLGGAAAAWPLAARAQQVKVPVIGWLNSGSPGYYGNLVRAFRQGLTEAGLVEGRTVTIEYRWAEDQYDRLPALAADLVRAQVAVIAATGGAPSAPAAKTATKTIPIVFQTGLDPIEAKLVPSLSRPGGNLTGVTTLSVELGPKRLELLHELVAGATDIALLVNPDNPNAQRLSRDAEAAGRTLRVRVHVLHASSEREFEPVFDALDKLQARAIAIGTDPLFNQRSEQLAALALRHGVPAIAQYREFAAAGGLMSYGGSLSTVYRLVGAYTGRILKGENPADLPVQQVTNVDLVLNLKTAKALRITVPLSLLGRADEVVE
jgi:putative tryptophan/tyrosine transport system substrate-binding protein